MNIKTVTTVDGINAVDFGAAASRFYWFENLGASTVYVSKNENIKAGDDDVKELAAGRGTMIETFDGKVYILGAGKVQITNQGDKFPPFYNAPVAGGGGGESKTEWIYAPDEDPCGLLANIMNTTGYNGGGYNISGGIQGRFGFYQSVSGYNITHSNLVDLTDIKKITINGGTVANTDKLSATAYYCISNETITELDDRWTEIHSSSGTAVSDFSVEIDCSGITGEKFIYLAILHGDESTSFSSYLYIDKITLSGGGINADYAANAGNADTVDGMHANDFIYPRAMLSKIDLNTIFYHCSALILADCTNIPTSNSWGTLLCYSGGTGSHVQLWVTATDSSMFKRHYDGARWSDWKEISTTPIKSVEIGGTTDAYGNFTIWKASDGKIPIYAKIFGYYVFPFLSEANNDYYYYLGICQTASHEWVANTAVSGTVYYIEI